MEKKPTIIKKGNNEGRELINEYTGLFNRLKNILTEGNNQELLLELNNFKKEFEENKKTNSMVLEKLESLVRKIESDEQKNLDDIVNEINSKEFSK